MAILHTNRYLSYEEYENFYILNIKDSDIIVHECKGCGFWSEKTECPYCKRKK